MPDITVRAGDLTNLAVGAALHATVRTRPDPSNGWRAGMRTLSGRLDRVEPFGQGAVKLILDGRSFFLDAKVSVRVDSRVAAAVCPRMQERLPVKTFQPEDVRVGVERTLLAASDFTADHVGESVEFTFRGTVFYGPLVQVSRVRAFGMVSVTIDGAEPFLFDEDEPIMLLAAAETHQVPAVPAPMEQTTAAPLAAEPDPAPAPVLAGVAVAPTSGGWRPFSDEDLDLG
ncbi:hypothetical protein [Curtobacterium sp. MCBD17_040]|uniref:hypothetical protein n=1 Tax=Curtobacterium sp. MCBD17_040 TaxID=2175674 RepID=UPI000DA75FE8|nr:hypothetical protein [Curtobacterium sp. MCBD17_040]WIB65319.1 hypothetical protein DEI94_18100 [Curtobacterium sp. MCBD17_040]